MTRTITLFLCAALLATAASAQNPPGACTTDERDFEALLASLRSEGWTVVPPGEALPERAVESIALARTVFYATGDRGGSTLPEIMDLQRRTVPGYARRVDTDLARQRVLTRGDEAMTLNWSLPQQSRPGIVEVICRIASAEGRPASGTAEGFGPSDARTLADRPLRRVMTVALEPALLTGLTTDATTTAIVETVTVLPPEPEQ